MSKKNKKQVNDFPSDVILKVEEFTSFLEKNKIAFVINLGHLRDTGDNKIKGDFLNTSAGKYKHVKETLKRFLTNEVFAEILMDVASEL